MQLWLLGFVVTFANATKAYISYVFLGQLADR